VSPPEKVSYGEHRSQFCELSLPDGDGPHPVAVLIHGGRWEHFYGRQLMRPQATDLVARGWATWNVEYRRIGGDGGYDATHADVAAAVDRLAGRPEPLDPSTVVAVGHSSGAQLALWLAARGAPITGAVAQSGLLDLEALATGAGSKPVLAFLGGDPGEVQDRYARASPARLLPLGVPVLVVHGEEDGTVPAAHAREFAAEARAAGDLCDLVVTPGEDHVAPLRPGSAAWMAVVEWLEGQRP